MPHTLPPPQPQPSALSAALNLLESSSCIAPWAASCFLAMWHPHGAAPAWSAPRGGARAARFRGGGIACRPPFLAPFHSHRRVILRSAIYVRPGVGGWRPAAAHCPPMLAPSTSPCTLPLLQTLLPSMMKAVALIALLLAVQGCRRGPGVWVRAGDQGAAAAAACTVLHQWS